jgi:pyruvate dehydrogenase E2 component (dihydrolipoamide acetyltransferase)
VAILGIGRIEQQPRVVDGQIVARDCLGVSFTFDHRVLDGEGAGQFLSTLRRYLEHPLELLLHPQFCSGSSWEKPAARTP